VLQPAAACVRVVQQPERVSCPLQPKENGAKKDAKGGVAIRLPYLRVVDVQDDSDSDSFTATFTWGLRAPHLPFSVH
jgi:hypothetical protein